MGIPIPEYTRSPSGGRLRRYGVVDGNSDYAPSLQFCWGERTEDQEGEDHNSFSLEVLRNVDL